MTLTAASINISFISNYTGCHRVCYRIQGDINYNCSNQVTCPGKGNPCNISIGIQVDIDSCDPVTYEGYVQACCEDENSLSGRIPFTITFTPDPLCKGYTITCNGPVSIPYVYVTDPGQGYPVGFTIPLNFSPSLGGISGYAVVGDGGISSQFGAATPFPFGAGYVDGIYYNVPAITLTGVGSGAQFTVIVSGGQVTSTIVQYSVNGTNYAPGDTITFNNSNLGGSGAGVIVTINNVNTGQIQHTVITNAGSGYTAPPTVTIPPSLSGQGLLQAPLGLCNDIILNTCSDPPYTVIAGVPVGTNFVTCLPDAQILPSEYSIEQNRCCNSCVEIIISKPDIVGTFNPPSNVYYMCCETKKIIALVINQGDIIGPICAVLDSWLVEETDPINGTTNIAVGIECTLGGC